MIEEIQAKARELLQDGTVSCVIGYERASSGDGARPCFAYEPSDVDKFIFDNACHNDLATYLRGLKGKKTAIVAKPYDSRAVNLLLNEKQIERQDVYIIGVVCAEDYRHKTKHARENASSYIDLAIPVIYDVLIGEAAEGDIGSEQAYSDVAEIEVKSTAERQEFWEEQFSRCIRCYACRQVCPGCYCTECFVEQLDPLWTGIRIAPSENQLWNVIRAFHLAGRCIGCNECERVCPMNIPLSLLNRKLEQQALEMFDFRSGMDAETAPHFATFKKDEHLGIG